MSANEASDPGEASAPGEEFLLRFHQIGEEMREKERAWIEGLRARGFAAAHPDDGWVDWHRHELQLVYPQFVDRLAIGVHVALGSAWSERGLKVVELTGTRRDLLGQVHWQFKEVN